MRSRASQLTGSDVKMYIIRQRFIHVDVQKKAPVIHIVTFVNNARLTLRIKMAFVILYMQILAKVLAMQMYIHTYMYHELS